MSIDPPSRDPDTQPFRRIGSGERKRAALVLGVLVVVAVLVVGVMIYALGSSKDSPPNTPNANPTGPAVTVTGGAPATTHPSVTRPKPTPKPRTTTHSSVPSGRSVSCPTSTPCALPDDIGNVVRALNSYRTSHGQHAVTGSVTKAARDCAVRSGNGPCPSGYFWEPVGRSGDEVIGKIAKSGKGTGWLLNPKMTTIQIGWAYLPSSKSFECVVVSNA